MNLPKCNIIPQFSSCNNIPHSLTYSTLCNISDTWPYIRTKVTDWKSKLLAALLSFMVVPSDDYYIYLTCDIESFFILHFL